MKRYHPILKHNKAKEYTVAAMAETELGEFVKYADVEALLEKISQDTDRDVQLIKANTREQILDPGAHNEQP